MHALPHLRPAVANLDPVVVAVEPHDGAGHLTQPVAEPSVLQAEPQPDGLARRDRRVVLGLDAIEALLRTCGAVVHHLPRAPQRLDG